MIDQHYDLHAKEKTIEDINAWPDVDLVAVTGDIVATGGNAGEYAFAKLFFSKLTKPVCFIGGNHDYIYPDSFLLDPATGHHLKEASPERRAGKLQRFKETWGMRELFYSRRMGNYLLVFLTPDALTGNDSCRITDRQLDWLKTELQRNRTTATIIFFHAPLVGTGTGGRDDAGKGDGDLNYAEPKVGIRAALRDNPQVFMWVSGHVHIAPTNEDFKSPRNLYENHVMVIHNPDMNGSSRLHNTDTTSTKHENQWTNSLFLYPDRVEIRTYDHKQGVWLHDLDRTVAPWAGRGYGLYGFPGAPLAREPSDYGLFLDTTDHFRPACNLGINSRFVGIDFNFDPPRAPQLTNLEHRPEEQEFSCLRVAELVNGSTLGRKKSGRTLPAGPLSSKPVGGGGSFTRRRCFRSPSCHRIIHLPISHSPPPIMGDWRSAGFQQP